MLRTRLERLDTSLFEHIVSQTTEPDRRSLLALHAAIAARGPFNYLEIGSHLGGSLQVLVADPRCRHITSIDTRPTFQPDDRGGVYHYDGNSTARMLGLLAEVADADLGKVVTLERGTDELTVDELAVRPYFCFVDGEHTRAAALRDARFCAEAIGEEGVLAFHDCHVVEAGIDDFLAELAGRRYAAFRMPDSVFVVELGAPWLQASPLVQQALIPLVR